MRTADRFLAREWVFPFGLDHHRPFMEEMAALLRGAPVIQADNVAHYVNDRNPSVCLEEYPSLAPPWPTFWVEYPSSSGRQRRGVMVMDATRWQDTPPSPEGTADSGGSVEELAGGAKRHAVENGATAVQWVVILILFVEQDRMVWGPAGMLALALDSGGQVVGNRWSIAPTSALIDAAKSTVAAHESKQEDDLPIPSVDQLEQMSDDERDAVVARLESRRGELEGYIDKTTRTIRDLRSAATVIHHLDQVMDEVEPDTAWLVRALAPAMQSVAFLHCRNVVLDTVRPPDKVQARRRRRGAPPLMRYQTIRLEVPRRQSGGGGWRAEDLTALHIVAGHFAHYGACCTTHEPHGLLFGKLSGVYWVASHARGDPSLGQVRTDFDLVSP